MSANRRLTARLGVWLLGAVTVAAVVLPFHLVARADASGAPFRMPRTHDLEQYFDHMRAHVDGLRAGRIYPRWYAEGNAGFGSPGPLYYPPGVYYVSTAAWALTRDWEWAFLLTHLTLFAAVAAAVYRAARNAMPRRAAAAAMVACLVLPYPVLDLYHRGAIAELLALAFMAMVVLASDRLLAESSWRPRRIAAVAAAYGALVLAHPPSAYPFTLALGVVAAVLASRRHTLRALAALAAALALGGGLAAYYALPVVAERHLVPLDAFREAWQYDSHHLPGPAPPDVPPGFWPLLQATWLLTSLVLAACTAVFHSCARPPRALGDRVLAWSAGAGLMVFLMTPLSAPLDHVIPGLSLVSFPWRTLSVSTLLAALVVGACASAVQEPLVARGRRLLVVGVCAASLVGSVSVSAAVARSRAGAPAFHPRPGRRPADVFTMVPRVAPARTELPAWDRTHLENGRGTVEVLRWDPEVRVLRVRLTGHDRLHVRTFHFPGWAASLDSRDVAILTGAHGHITVDLPSGDHRIRLELRLTPVRRVGAATTLASLSLLVVLLSAARPRAG